MLEKNYKQLKRKKANIRRNVKVFLVLPILLVVFGRNDLLLRRRSF